MQDLIELFEDSGFIHVRTYIQSGNVVCQHKSKDISKSTRELRRRIKDRAGFEAKVLLLNPLELRVAVENNPFDVGEGKALHLYFLASEPSNPDLTKLINAKSESEDFRLTGSVFYLYAPDGIGRSKLAASVEGCLKVAATSRNWNTVKKLMTLVEAKHGG